VWVSTVHFPSLPDRNGPRAQTDKSRSESALISPNSSGGGPRATEHPTGEGKLYLCAVKDVFAGRIVGYSMGLPPVELTP
jgi:hypothetical protein